MSGYTRLILRQLNKVWKSVTGDSVSSQTGIILDKLNKTWEQISTKTVGTLTNVPPPPIVNLPRLTQNLSYYADKRYCWCDLDKQHISTRKVDGHCETVL
jgi:hypothetical protein